MKPSSDGLEARRVPKRRCGLCGWTRWLALPSLLFAMTAVHGSASAEEWAEVQLHGNESLISSILKSVVWTLDDRLIRAALIEIIDEIDSDGSGPVDLNKLMELMMDN